MKRFFLLSLFSVVLGCFLQFPVFSGGQKESQKVEQQSSTQKVNGNEAKAPAYFSGNAGMGITITVLEPTGVNVPKAEQYVLPLIQSSITGDFNKLSHMKIVDRINLDKVLAEQKFSTTGIFSDDDFIKIGQLTNAKYILIGTLTKTASAYMLEFAVTDVQEGIRKASFSPKTVSFLAIENLSTVKEATADLLAQLGVELTTAGKDELHKKTNTAQAQAETALSKALVAQKSGTTVEALSYYFQAVNLDPNLTEAASRLNVLSANISSGNIGEDARNEIQWRKDWIARLTECEDYVRNYLKNPPYTLTYTTNIIKGKIDFTKETVDLGINLYLIPNVRWFEIPTQVVNKVKEGLKATGQESTWGIKWPEKSISINSPFINIVARLTVEVELQNEKNVVIATTTVPIDYGWKFDTSGPQDFKIIVNNSTFNGVTLTANANDVTTNLKVKIKGVQSSRLEATKNFYPVTYDALYRRYDLFNEIVSNAVTMGIKIIPDEEFRKEFGYTVGDRGPTGGLIFYDKGSYSDGWRYLEAETKEKEIRLPFFGGWVGYENWEKTSAAVGSGKRNTQLLFGSLLYGDWFLPSIGELKLLGQVTRKFGVFGSLYNAGAGIRRTISSTLEDPRRAYGYLLDTDEQMYITFRQNNYTVRPIRSF